MNAWYNIIGTLADILFQFSYDANVLASSLNAKAVKLKMAMYAEDHPSGGSSESD